MGPATLAVVEKSPLVHSADARDIAGAGANYRIEAIGAGVRMITPSWMMRYLPAAENAQRCP
jgi:hypothetical protein